MGLLRRDLRNKRVTPADKIRAIEISYGLEFGTLDIGYMLDIHPMVIAQRFQKIGKRDKSKGILEHHKRFGEKGPYLSYRDAYQIYGFTDEMNASREEIADALGKPKELVDYVLEHRAEIGPRLIHALRVMYPKEDITKPYR